MFIDMHTHELRYSKDSYLMLEQMVELGKRRGLDGICVTDHDDMGLKAFAAEYSKKVNFPIFVGIEFYSLQGDIIAFGIDEYPPERVSAQEFIDIVQAQGGVCFAAHPFRNNNRGLEENLKVVKGLDGIEVLNGSTPFEPNKKAVDYARELGKAMLGSSDCHVIEKSGIYATYFPREIRTVEELIQAIKNHECRPAYYHEGGYHLWDMEHPVPAPFKIEDGTGKGMVDYRYHPFETNLEEINYNCINQK